MSILKNDYINVKYTRTYDLLPQWMFYICFVRILVYEKIAQEVCRIHFLLPFGLAQK
jgi:hypothetical protein